MLIVFSYPQKPVFLSKCGENAGWVFYPFFLIEFPTSWFMDSVYICIVLSQQNIRKSYFFICEANKKSFLLFWKRKVEVFLFDKEPNETQYKNNRFDNILWNNVI